MRRFQEIFEKSLRDALNFPDIAAQIIEDELSKNDVSLTKSQKRQLVKQLNYEVENRRIGDCLFLEINDNGKLIISHEERETTGTIDLVAPGDEFISKFEKSIPELVENISDDVSASVLSSLYNHWC